MQPRRSLKRVFFATAFVATLIGGSQGASAGVKPTTPLQKKLIATADRILEEREISYVYGGSRLGNDKDCEDCNVCLKEKKPAPKKRATECSMCTRCSLDCSHYIQLIFNESGIPLPYLDTNTMLTLSPKDLFNRYQLLDFRQRLLSARPGDLLVYKGHVVLLTATHDLGKGDIIHATGGKDIREPGQGIQRERFVLLQNFRGPLLRILRHRRLN